ncbi:MAG: phospholipase, partial [Proteobacteria bacterium]
MKHVSTTVLERLREGIATGRLPLPLDQVSLVGFGLRHRLAELEAALGGQTSAACLAILDVTLSEREERRPTPELVWTGPEASGGTARDTAVVLRSLFEGARESVVLAGYSFDHAHEVLAPLHRSMVTHGVAASFFVDVPQIERGVGAEAHLATHLSGFLRSNWPFGAPHPVIYYDRRALHPGPPWCSLHAKCVVIDGSKAFVSSANFTQRGQERNFEVGVLVEDA